MPNSGFEICFKVCKHCNIPSSAHVLPTIATIMSLYGACFAGPPPVFLTSTFCFMEADFKSFHFFLQSSSVLVAPLVNAFTADTIRAQASFFFRMFMLDCSLLWMMSFSVIMPSSKYLTSSSVKFGFLSLLSAIFLDRLMQITLQIDDLKLRWLFRGCTAFFISPFVQQQSTVNWVDSYVVYLT